MDTIAKQADADADADADAPEIKELQVSVPSRKRKSSDMPEQSTQPSKRARTSQATSSVTSSIQPQTQSANNRRRARKRAQKVETHGHPQGFGRAFDHFVLTADPIQTGLVSEQLPIAEGAWVATNSRYVGRTVKRKLEDLKADGFTHIAWKGKVPISVVDDKERVVLVAVGKPNDPSYQSDADKMADEMLNMGRTADWEYSDKHGVRGNFASASYGWSFGKGQPQPMLLGGKHAGMMSEFIEAKYVQRVAAYQSASFALWFPKAYGEFRRRNEQLSQKIPEFEGNIKHSVFSCCTANCGPDTWTHIHRDSKNVPGPCCAITAGGDFDPTKGGQLIVWDLKLVFDFPPGSTILLPSALFRHSNIPIQKGERRTSFTQYTAGGIHRWLEYGGRTEEQLAVEDPDEYARILEERPERWRKALNMFSTIAELRAGLIV